LVVGGFGVAPLHRPRRSPSPPAGEDHERNASQLDPPPCNGGGGPCAAWWRGPGPTAYCLLPTAYWLFPPPLRGGKLQQLDRIKILHAAADALGGVEQHVGLGRERVAQHVHPLPVDHEIAPPEVAEG